MNRVYIVIVNWNGWRDTIECLESVFRNTYSSYRVIVCDNDSRDNSPEYIKAWAENRLAPLVPDGELKSLSWPPVAKPISYEEYDRAEAESGGCLDTCHPLVLIHTGGNLGFAGGNNVGLRYALARGDFDYVWLLNNDTVIKPDALSMLVRRVQEKPSAGMCGSTLLYYGQPDKVQALGGGWYCKWIGLPWHYGRFEIRRFSADTIDSSLAEKRMNYVEGASLLVSKPFLCETGLMCEDYFLFFEETDWAERSRPNFALAYAPASIVFHKVGNSIGTSSNPLKKSSVCDYYNIRNRLFFTSRFYPHLTPFIIFFILMEILLRAFLFMPGRSKQLILILWGFLSRPHKLYGQNDNA